MTADTGPSRLTRTLAILASVVALVTIGLFALYYFEVIDLNGAVSAQDLERVLIVAASADESGSVVGQIVIIIDLSGSEPTVESVSSGLEVTIPGTSYATLGDAYPFGGGRGTADALARVRKEPTLPHLSLEPEDLREIVDLAGGLPVDLPTAMNVFDGRALYSLRPGTQRLSSRELEAVLKGAPYLSAKDRAALDSSLADGLFSALVASPGTLRSLETDLDVEAVDRLESLLEESAR